VTRLAASFIPAAAFAVGLAALAFELWPRTVETPPTPIIVTVTTDPPRTVTVMDPPPVSLVVLRASTERDVPAPDLDGDGTPESFETRPDSCGTGGCVYDVYLSSAPEKRAGKLDTKWGYWTMKPRRGAPADITTAWFLGCCDIALTTYRFRRGQYREIAHKRCDPREGHTPACD
jgi:hypothetical protein